MDNLATLLIAGIAVEALFQVLRPIWEPAVRQEWASFTRLAMLALVLMLVVGGSDWNLLAGTGFDLGIPALGRALTALSVVRVTHWVHEVYKRTSR